MGEGVLDIIKWLRPHALSTAWVERHVPDPRSPTNFGLTRVTVGEIVRRLERAIRNDVAVERRLADEHLRKKNQEIRHLRRVVGRVHGCELSECGLYGPCDTCSVMRDMKRKGNRNGKRKA